MIGQRSSTRFDYLRQLAASTSPPCTSGNFSSGSNNQYGIQETWTVSSPINSNTRMVELVLQYKASGRTVRDTVKTFILCK